MLQFATVSLSDIQQVKGLVLDGGTTLAQRVVGDIRMLREASGSAGIELEVNEGL